MHFWITPFRENRIEKGNIRSIDSRPLTNGINKIVRCLLRAIDTIEERDEIKMTADIITIAN